MGALYWQPAVHFRQGHAASWINPAILPNHLAVHSAAAAGHMEIVMLLLEAENMRDLNTKTFHSKDSLVHVAVANGHRALADMLATLGADIRDRNAKGQRVSDMTTDKDWKRALMTKIVKRVRTFGDIHMASRDGLFQQQQLQQAEQLLQALALQRAQESDKKTTSKPKKKKT